MEQRGCDDASSLFIIQALMITILQIKHAKDSVNAILDNGETLRIPLRLLSQYRLDAGRTIGSEEYSQLKEESNRFRCGLSALDYLAVRPRSAAEMQRYLSKKGFSHDNISEAVRGLVEAGYLDDHDFAVRYVNGRLNRKTVGRNLLAAELQKKGIAKEIIRRVLRESEALHGNVDELYRLAIKKYDSIKHKKNSITKLAMFLYGRGFDRDAIAAVVDRIRGDENPESGAGDDAGD